MTDQKATLIQLNKNLNILQEREAKYGGNAPLELLNQIDDHEKAINLTQQVIRGELTKSEWAEALSTLLLAVNNGQVVNLEVDNYVAGDVVAGDKINGDKIGRDKVTVGHVENAAVSIGERSAAATKGGVAVSGDVTGDLIISVGNTKLAIPRLAQIAFVVITVGIIFLLSVQVYSFYTSIQLVPMPDGKFNIAIAQFQVEGTGEGLEDAKGLAQGFANTIEQEIDELSDSFGDRIQIRYLNEVGPITGKTEVERTKNAKDLADTINANIIIYGTIELNGLVATIKPEFYVRVSDFSSAGEVTGQYRMGEELILEKVDNKSLRDDVENITRERFRALLFIIDGLSDYVVGKYEEAESKFNQALGINAWKNPDVMYVLLGNVALRQRDWNLAKDRYTNAQNINPDYARAYVGLGSVFLAQSTTDLESENYDFNSQLMDSAIENYEKALESKEQPPLADISAKANFGLGVAYLQKALIEQENGNNLTRDQYYDYAIQKFRLVIQDYETGNKRIPELAAHSHARLGLIYRLNGKVDSAVSEYEQAIEFLPNYGSAKKIKADYQEILDKLK